MIGETVYHYRILEKIGEGGMGVVYKAEDINLRRTVALKFLSPVSVQRGSMRERVMKEARAAASLDHQNICAIHEVEEFEDRLFIVMAYCEGRTLGAIIRDGRPGLKDSLDILIQIADGLGAAHEAGIIHRDIKPANVIVSDRGRVKIMDFGLAKQSGAQTVSMTMAGAGTLAYMSPEQVRGEDVDPRADIWSLGVLMYQMLTGSRPFEGDYDASVLYNIVNEPHVPAADLDPDIPRELTAIIEKMLKKSPGDRYRSMAALREDLAGVRDHLFGRPETSRTSGGFLGTGKRISGWKIKSILALAVSSALIFFIIHYLLIDTGTQPAESAGKKDSAESSTPDPAALDRAQVMYSSGAEMYHSGNHTNGIRLIEHALELDPDHFDALKTLAVFYDWGGDYERASRYIGRAKNIAKKRGNTDEYVVCAIIQEKVLHNWDMALKLFNEYYAEHPEAVTTQIEIGYILSRYVGDNRGALEHYAIFFEKDPENRTGRHAQVYDYTGTANLYLGEFDAAIEAFTRYRDLLPDSPDPISSLAGAYLFAGRYKEAYRLYSELLRDNDPAYTVHDGLGRTCAETGRLRESSEHFNRYLGAVTFNGQKVNGHLQIARNYLTQKNAVSFDREMERIDEIDSLSAQACWLRGFRYITLEKDIDKARGEFIRLKDLMERPFVFEETSRSEHLRGLILLAEGRTAGTLEALQEAVRRSPRDFLFFGREHARVLLEIGKTEQAISACLGLASYNPNDPLLLMIMCRAYRLSGDMASAKEYYERTMKVLSEADEDFLPLIEFREEFVKAPGT